VHTRRDLCSARPSNSGPGRFIPGVQKEFRMRCSPASALGQLPWCILILALGACAGRTGPSDAGLPAPTMEPHARVIGPLDLLEIAVMDAPEFSRLARVSEQGEISLPLLGLSPAAGLTPHQLEVALADRLRHTYMVDPQVTVQVREAATDPIYVVGEVGQPGAFTASGANQLTVLQAVALARGLKPTASKRGVFVIRKAADGSRLQIPVRFNDVVRGRAPDLLLEPSDVVYVPTNMERSVALGVVNTLVRVVTFRAVF
jgi:polysaccharide biosynthesis/export protein